MNQFFSEVSKFLAKSGLPVLTLIISILLGFFIIRCLMKIFKQLFLQSSIDKLLVRFILSIIRIVLWVVLFLVCFKMVGINTSGFVAAISAIMLAIGLSIQDIISGVASGMILVTTHPFKIGDYIETSDVGGSIKEVTLFHTILTTPDNKRVRVPNNTIFNEIMTNYSSNDLRRLDIKIGIDYSVKKEKVKEVLLKTASLNPLVLKEPTPVVRVSEIRVGDVEYLLRLWVNNSSYWTLKFELQEAILESFRENGITVSMPQVTVSYRDNLASVPFSTVENGKGESNV